MVCYDDHDDDDDDECVEDEICDFENFQLNEIESSFFPFPGGFFFVLFLFIVAIYVICIYENVFLKFSFLICICFVWGFL